jgi:hypothetical protein
VKNWIYNSIVVFAVGFGMPDVASADDFEVSDFIVNVTPLPAGFDLLGAKTGVPIAEVAAALEAAGYSERLITKGDGLTRQSLPERWSVPISCALRDCLVYNGQKEFFETFRWYKDNEEITVKVSSPLLEVSSI